MRTPKLTPAVVLALLIASLPAAAQDQSLAMAYLVTPKADAATGFEAAFKQHMDWRSENGDPWGWQVYQVVTGPNLGGYVVRSGGHSWADIDSYEASDFQPGAQAHFGANVAPLMESVSNSISATNPDINRPPPDGTSINLFAVTTYHLKPGQGPAFNRALARFHEVVVEGDYPIYYIMGTPIFGTAGPQVQFVNFSADWAGFGSGGPPLIQFLTEALGEDELAELFQDFSNTFTSTESIVVRIRRDLSTTPAN